MFGNKHKTQKALTKKYPGRKSYEPELRKPDKMVFGTTKGLYLFFQLKNMALSWNEIKTRAILSSKKWESKTFYSEQGLPLGLRETHSRLVCEGKEEKSEVVQSNIFKT